MFFHDEQHNIPIQFAAVVNFGPLSIRRAAWDDVGGLDQGYNDPGMCGICTDFDLTSRLWLAGWQVREGDEEGGGVAGVKGRGRWAGCGGEGGREKGANGRGGEVAEAEPGVAGRVGSERGRGGGESGWRLGCFDGWQWGTRPAPAGRRRSPAHAGGDPQRRQACAATTCVRRGAARRPGSFGRAGVGPCQPWLSMKHAEQSPCLPSQSRPWPWPAA